MDKVEFLQKESELFFIFNSFEMSKEILKCGTYSEICLAFYKKNNKELQKFYDNFKIGEDRNDFIELEILFKLILFGCDDRSSKSIEDQLFKVMWEYVEIKLEYFENQIALFVDNIFFKISTFVEMYYEMHFSTKSLFEKLGKKIDEYFENKKKEDEVIEDEFGRSNWPDNKLSKESEDLLNDIKTKADEIRKKIKEDPDRIWIPNIEENRKLIEEENMFNDWQVPSDKIILNSTPTSDNSFYKQFLKTKASAKERNEKICKDDILNLEIAFNTAKSFEDFLNLV